MPLTSDILSSQLLDGSTLQTLLGSFWSQLYSGKDFVNDILRSRAQAELQTYSDFQEYANAVSRKTIDVFHTKLLAKLAILQSQLVQGKTVRFGQGYKFGLQPTSGIFVQYGTNAAQQFSWPIDSTLADVRIICDTPTASNLMLIRGVDFDIDTISHTVSFLDNPFSNTALSQLPIYTNNQISDYEIDLWMYRPQIDTSLLYNQYGYVINTNFPSSQNYKDVLTAIFDAIVSGSSRYQLERLFAAAADTPIVGSDNETVTVIETDANHLLIITNVAVYKFPTSATPVVSVGQVVNNGDQLVDTVNIFEFLSNDIPAALSGSSITLSGSQLLGTYSGTVGFSDTTAATTVTLNVNGKTKIEWPLTVSVSGDNTQFWSVCHTAGVAAGKTLANLLDNRANPVGEPTAANLPATINPLAFLIANVLRYNAIMVILKTGQFGPNAIDLSALTPIYRKIVPPGKMLLIKQV